jgi:phosphodiesterase/alkaline phosphatase D-like protein
MRRRRIAQLLAVVVPLVALALSASHSSSAPMLAVADFSVLLGRPTDHSVTANVIPDQTGQISFEYGTTPAYGTQTGATACTAAEPVEVVIDGLAADTLYYYQLRFRATSGEPWTGGGQHSFHTQRPPGSPFTFTITSDSHLGQYGGQTTEQRALYERSLTHVAAEGPDFHLDLGDTFAMDPSPLGTGMTEAEARAAYLVQRQPDSLDIIGADIPFFLAIGNHENEEGWNWDDTWPSVPTDGSLAIRGIKARKLYIPNPVPDDFYTGNTDVSWTAIEGDHLHEDYFAWTWGDALFVVLDPFHYTPIWPSEGSTYGGEGTDGEAQGDRWDWTLGYQQYQWLKTTLESSDAQWKFVFLHHLTGGVIPYGRGGVGAAPYFEWGGLNWDGTDGFAAHRPGWEMPIHDLLVANGVDILFHGHDHFFSKEELDGIVYLEVPKPDDIGSATDYRNDGGGYPTGDNIQLACGHIRVQVSADQLQVDYVRSLLSGNDGEILYSFTLPPEPPASVASAATPSDATPAVGQQIVVGINIDMSGAVPPDHQLGSFSGSLTWDPAVLTYNTNSGLLAGFTGAVNTANVLTGTIAFNGANATGATGNNIVFQVTLDAAALGTSALNLEYTAMAAAYTFTDLQSILTVTDGHVVVGPATLGDVNGDGLVNSTDALIILSADVGMNTPQFCPMNCGDATGDALVNSTDALVILSYDVGMSVPFAVGTGPCPSAVTQPAGCTP